MSRIQGRRKYGVAPAVPTVADLPIHGDYRIGKAVRGHKMNTIFVGLDVHKETISIYGFHAKTGEILVETSLRNDTPKVIDLLKSLKRGRAKIQVCYEAGCLGFGLQREITERGIHCDVIAPSRIPRTAGDRIKTDRRDAAKLAQLYAAGQLTPVTVPSEETEAARSLTRLREDVRSDEHKARQRLLGFCLARQRPYPAGKHWTRAHFDFLSKVTFPNALDQHVFEAYLAEVLRQANRMKEITARIEETATSKPFNGKVSRLRTLKGIDYYSALALIAEIGDFNRFETAAHFMSYIGLVPGQRSSGNTIRMTSITKTGNGFIRKILNQASQCYRYKSMPSERLAAKRANQPPSVLAYAEKAQSRCERKFSKMRARNKTYQTTVTAVSRELSGFVWGLMTGKIAA